MIHGVPAMIRHLRHKPVVKCHDEGRIRRGVSNLSSVRQGGIANVDLREPGFQFSQPRHVIAVKVHCERIPRSLPRGKRAKWKSCLSLSLHFEESLQQTAWIFNPGRIGEVTLAELVRLVLKVGLDQGDQPRIRRIFHCHRLSPAAIQPLKDMDRLFKVEWHHLRAARRDLGLAGTAGRYNEAKSNHQDGNRI